MRGHAHGDTGQTGGDDGGNGGGFRQDQGEWAGPEFLGELEGRGIGEGDLGKVGERMQVDDERIGAGTALGGENFFAGAWIERIGGKAVNRFGGHADQFALAQTARERRQVSRRAAKNAGGGLSRHGHEKGRSDGLRPEREL